MFSLPSAVRMRNTGGVDNHGSRMCPANVVGFSCAANRRLLEAIVLLTGLRELLKSVVSSIVQDGEHGDLVIVAPVRNPILSDQKLTDLGAPELRHHAAPIRELSK